MSIPVSLFSFFVLKKTGKKEREEDVEAQGIFDFL